MVVGDLFSRQCKPWKAISQNLVELIHEAALSTITKLLLEICDENTKNRLMKGVIQPSLYKLRQELQDQLSGFLEPHLSIHPISYNADLIDKVQAIQAKRHQRKFDQAAAASCGFDTQTAEDTEYTEVLLQKLLQDLLKATEPNVQEYSASLALDVSEAYYHVSHSFFGTEEVSFKAREKSHTATESLYLCVAPMIGCIEEVCRRSQRQCCRGVPHTASARRVSVPSLPI